jgi:hypothetical protein
MVAMLRSSIGIESGFKKAIQDHVDKLDLKLQSKIYL